MLTATIIDEIIRYITESNEFSYKIVHFDIEERELSLYVCTGSGYHMLSFVQSYLLRDYDNRFRIRVLYIPPVSIKPHIIRESYVLDFSSDTLKLIEHNITKKGDF